MYAHPHPYRLFKDIVPKMPYTVLSNIADFTFHFSIKFITLYLHTYNTDNKRKSKKKKKKKNAFSSYKDFLQRIYRSIGKWRASCMVPCPFSR